MRLARFLLNTLLFIVTFCLFLLAQYSLTALVCLQGGGDVDRVRFKADETQVSYFDAATFLADDMKAGYANEDPYWVRSWFGSPDWWANAMGWADTALAKVTVTVKAIFVPVLDIRDMKELHITGYWEDNGDGTETFKEATMSEITGGLGLSGNYEAWAIILNSDAAREKLDTDEISKTSRELSIMTLESVINGTKSDNEWIDEYPDSYNFIRLASHYNTPEMEKYYTKFIDEDVIENADGTVTVIKSIKFEAVSMYIQYYIAIILSAFFVRNNRFRIRRDEDTDENVVEGGLKILPGFRKKKKKKKKKNANEA